MEEIGNIDERKWKNVSGADLIVSVFKSHGVKFVGNLCGESTTYFMLEAAKAGIRVINTRNEATAVFAAKASGRLTGIPGIVVTTSGPGLANTILGALDGKLDEVPIIIISSAVPTSLRNMGYLQDIDHVELMKVPCKASMSIDKKSKVVSMMKSAFQIASSGIPGPVYVQIPVDVFVPNYKVEFRPLLRQALEETETSVNDEPVDERKVDYSPLRIIFPKASKDDVKESARIINNAKKPVFLIGPQATLRPEKIDKLSSALKGLKIPMFTIFDAKGLLGRSHEYLLFYDTLVKSVFSRADVIILAGAKCDLTIELGTILPASAKIISVNRSRTIATLNDGVYWKSKQIVESDVGYYLRKLSTQIAGYSPDESWITSLKAEQDAFEAKLNKSANKNADKHLNPAAILRAVDRSQTGKDVIYAFDVGDFGQLARSFIRINAPLHSIGGFPFAGVGVGVGYAIGAKLVHPDKDVICIVGDGSVGYSIMEFDTLNREKLNVLAVCGNDGRWGEICRKQIEEFGTDTNCTLLYTHYEKIVVPLGGKGFYVDERNGSALEEIFRTAAAAAQNTSVFVNAIMGTTDLRDGHLKIMD